MKTSVTTQTFPMPNLKLQKVHQFKWHSFCNDQQYRVRVMVFNATFNNISVISWWSVLLVEETGVHGEIHWPVTSNWKLYHIMLWPRQPLIRFRGQVELKLNVLCKIKGCYLLSEMFVWNLKKKLILYAKCKVYHFVETYSCSRLWHFIIKREI